nr:MAG TPA: hypothetical protein [Caudoviricetes sp.]
MEVRVNNLYIPFQRAEDRCRDTFIEQTTSYMSKKWSVLNLILGLNFKEN